MPNRAMSRPEKKLVAISVTDPIDQIRLTFVSANLSNRNSEKNE